MRHRLEDLVDRACTWVVDRALRRFGRELLEPEHRSVAELTARVTTLERGTGDRDQRLAALEEITHIQAEAMRIAERGEERLCGDAWDLYQQALLKYRRP